jgi:hypothetical protein
MAKNISFCEVVKQIQADPFKKVDFTVGYFYLLKQHLQECEACFNIVEEVTEKYRDVPPNPNSEWDKTSYN